MARLNRRQALGTLLLGIAGAGCQRPAPSVERSFMSFATIINVRIDDPVGTSAQRAIDALQVAFATINRDWYAFGVGELGQVNAALRAGKSARLSEPLGELILRAQTLRSRSGGRFDPAIGNLGALWHFDEFATGGPLDAIAEAGDIARALAINTAGFTLTRDDGYWTLRAGAPGLQIDLGGIAKGAALALGANLFREHGIDRALIDAGGDIITLGAAQSAPFRIGLKDPRAVSVSAAISVQAGEAIMSSGDYARFWLIDGKRYQHIIDPRSGWPVTAAQACTVVHRDPLLADAAATALIVAGAGDFLSVCDAMGVDKALLVDNLGVMQTTPAMQARLTG